MDEPFSALDELTRAQLQDDLLQLWSGSARRSLFVTHNISEAIYLADRVVVMSAHPGRIKTTSCRPRFRVRAPRTARNRRNSSAGLRQAREALRS